MKLSHVAQGKDNNLNLLRVLAASAVLVSHSYPLVGGPTAGDPLYRWCGVSIGNIAVDVFFLISGFLVTGSLLAKQNALDFVVSRMLRIYPALIVSILFAIAVGLEFSTLPEADYLTAAGTRRYLLNIVFIPARYVDLLPGVFERLPFAGAVNGSLWTLTYELRMYILLLVVWGAASLAGTRRLRAFGALVVALAVVTGVSSIVLRVQPDTRPGAVFVALAFMFFAGAAYAVLKQRVALTLPAASACVGALAIAGCLGGTFCYPVYLATVAYLVLYVAYVPRGFFRAYNHVGDYSYGIYIFAFTVQQAIVATMPGVTTAGLIALAAPATLVLAMLSWHLVEKRCLALKNRFMHHSRFAPTV